MIVNNSGDIVKGVKDRDIKRVLNGAKTLGKMAAIGAITVGAIKIEPDKGKEKEKDKDKDKDEFSPE